MTIFAKMLIVVLALLLNVSTAAFAITSPSITDGTYVAATIYNSGFPVSYTSPGGFNYTNGNPASLSALTNLSSTATSVASLTINQLGISLSGSQTYTSGTAEMWDTLTFNLPSGGGKTITASTVLGTLNLSVYNSIGTATYPVNKSVSFGLDLYNTSSFSPPANTDCGILACSNGYIASSSGNTFMNGKTQVFSVPITFGELTNGQVAYISEIKASNYADPSLNLPLTIDPSVTLTGIFPGVTVKSLSETNYVAAVPEPETYAMLLAGLGMIGFIIYRRKNDSTT